MPHVDIMFSQLQSRLIDAVKANNYLQTFNSEIQKIRDEYINISFPSEPKRRKFNTDRSIAAKEVCDVILIQCRERFSFTKHLKASKLLLIDNFHEYETFSKRCTRSSCCCLPDVGKRKPENKTLGVLFKNRYAPLKNPYCNVRQGKRSKFRINIFKYHQTD